MLVETNVSVAVAVLYSDNHVANDSHTWTVSEKLLVCGFRIILLCLYELVVEVNVIPLALFQLPCGQQAIEEQCVQLICRVEVMGLACVGCVGNVILGSENRVGTTCASVSGEARDGTSDGGGG